MRGRGCQINVACFNRGYQRIYPNKKEKKLISHFNYAVKVYGIYGNSSLSARDSKLEAGGEALHNKEKNNRSISFLPGIQLRLL
ncbi:hypothetical protein TNCV_5107791 [Trichonephila clavipes]|nr:hypothetical protein TNCV_5107791 [Trichonephila clavipes]